MKNKKLLIFLYSLILPAVFIILWEVSSAKTGNAAVLPPVEKVLNIFIHSFDNFIDWAVYPVI